MAKEKLIISPYVYPGIKEHDALKIRGGLYRNFRMTPEEVMNIVAKSYGITSKDILSRVRKQEMCDARHTFCAIMRKHFRCSLKSIGEMVSGRDHTTAIHSIQTFDDRYKNEEDFKDFSDRIISKVLSKI
jgi:chromosomal replication initiator protein